MTLRIATGPFKSTPIDSLRVLTGEPALHWMCEKLLLRYYFKNKHFILNLAYDCVVNRNNEEYFISCPGNLTPLVLRIRDALHKRTIQTQPVIHTSPLNMYKWRMKDPVIDLQMRKLTNGHNSAGSRSVLSCEIVQEHYEKYRKVFTDGSKTVNGAEAAAVLERDVRKIVLPGVPSTF